MRYSVILLLTIYLAAKCSADLDDMTSKFKESVAWTKKYLRKTYNNVIQKLLLNEVPQLPNDLVHEPMGREITRKSNVEPESSTTEQPPHAMPGTPTMVQSHGYPLEVHEVVTKDGYVLTVHRIPYSRKSPDKISDGTVLMHHGLLGSSVDWVIAGPSNSLAYILSDSGYDVWMANMRGNMYSQKHVMLSVTSAKFWNFSFHEVSQRDLPAIIEYIVLSKNNTFKLNFIGHSMGATVLFAMLATKPKYERYLRCAVTLAPVAFMTEIQSPLYCMSRYSSDEQFMHRVFGMFDFKPSRAVVKWAGHLMCEFHHYNKVICDNLLFVICGFNDKQFNMSMLPSVLSYFPADTSTKNMVHFAQLAGKGRFQRFDYGTLGNIAQYGTSRPPDYDLGSVSLPIALMTSKNDWFANRNDSIKLHYKLKNSKLFMVPSAEFHNLDFLWGVDAPSVVYNNVQLYLKHLEIVPYFKANFNRNGTSIKVRTRADMNKIQSPDLDDLNDYT